MSSTNRPLDERRRLGRTDLHVSPIGFGGAPLGLRGYLTLEDRDSESFVKEGVAAIHEAMDGGINLFDTARDYGNGRSERIIGRAVEGRRQEVVITTKCRIEPEATAEHWQEKLEESLKRLGTDYVDVLQFHGGYYGDELAEKILESGMLEWAAQAKSRGAIRFLGITAENTSSGLERLIRTNRFDVLQIGFNLISQSHCDYARADEGVITGVIPLARSLDMGIMTMRTTTSGFLAKLLSQQLPGITEADVARLCIRFVLSVKEVDCALIGMTNRALVSENIALAVDRDNRLDLLDLYVRYPQGRQPEESA
jgi:uncharacterized protein